MPRAALTVQETKLAGLEAAYTGMTADGVSFVNDGKTIIHVQNSAATDAVVTVKTPAKYSGLDLADLTVTVPASESRFIGPFLPRDFSQTDKTVYVDTDTATTTLIAAIKLG